MIELIKPELKSVSHSMVESFLTCPKKFTLAHVENLQAKREGKGTSIGSGGHKFLEHFFRAIKDDDASDADALRIALEKCALEGVPILSIEKAMNWTQKIWPTLNWKILEVEVKFRVPTGEGTFFPGTIDLIVQLPDGKIAIVDHKFVYDFYDRELVDIMGQLPKYFGAMLMLGRRVDTAFYNQIRTRNVKDEDLKYSLIEVPITKERAQEAIRQQIMVSQQINNGYYDYKNSSKPTCQYCPFKAICMQDVNGRPTKMLKQLDYEPSDYNYNGEVIQ